MLKKMSVIYMLLFLLLLVGCGSNNKKSLEENLFKDGEALVQAYYQSANGADKSKEIQELAPKFDEMKKANTFSSEDEEWFVKEIQLLKQEYALYMMEGALEYASKNTQGNKEGAKEEMMKHMKELQDDFGVVYDKK
ncbi:hypothetical protein IEK_01263 [Bacillus toyonensis]|uniref:Lipoprotein n=1 Tax=Bacillus luti TaxID=2026191 RepID=A0A7V7SAI2_9BACI|nr:MULTISPECIES: hypothetical protein [Bacillus cereus group]EJV52614.1 hypothetical protein IEK_01263 [Bacillus toyonensis]KAB2444728.1 hypothetical protein F8163_05970 [Bacillus luti]